MRLPFLFLLSLFLGCVSVSSLKKSNLLQLKNYSSSKKLHELASSTSSSSDSTVSFISTGIASDAKTRKTWNWPNGDDFDKRILSIALPAILNFAILPLVGAADTFWVGRMKNALALAGQGAANQVFSSAFWIISFLPSVVTPLVAKAAAAGDTEKVQDSVGEAIFVGTIMGALGMLLLTVVPDFVLKFVLPQLSASPAYEFAAPYLKVRALTFIPALLSTVAFSAFRGTMDVLTPLKISALSNLINVILDPLLIFNAGMGVAGAAAATCVAEVVSFLLYIYQLFNKKMLKSSKLMKLPSLAAVKPLLFGGLGVQLRAVALNIAFLAVGRTTQALDTTGTAAAAHAITIQLWQLGGVVLLAMSTVASILVPSEIAKSQKEGKSLQQARNAADRLLLWGALLGVALGFVQLLSLPLLKVFSPLEDIQKAARLPSMIGAALQLINGVVFIGEGIQQGNQHFVSLAVVTAIATTGMLTSLKFFGNTLAGVWGSFAVFNLIRLIGVLRHHLISGPLSPRNIAKSQQQNK